MLSPSSSELRPFANLETQHFRIFPKFLPALPDRHTFHRTVGELANVPKDYEVSHLSFQ